MITINEKYMQRCIQIARNGAGYTAPNPMVGAVLVDKDGLIIGEGFHRCCGGPHAEVNAITAVKDESLLKNATLYVSLEPCSHYGKTPPCAEFIIHKQIPRVVVGCLDPFPEVAGRGVRMLRNAGVEVVTGILEKEARELNLAFMTMQEKHRPYVILKWAQSADGYIDILRENNEIPPVVLSSSRTRRMIHRLRAESAAILVGTHTALLDNPSLTVRSWDGKNPVRVVIDRTLKIPAHHHLFDDSAPTLVLTEKKQPNKIGNNIEYIQTNFSSLIPQIMEILYTKKLNSLIVEGGTHTLEQFLASPYWDEARIETSPVFLGSGIKAPELRKSYRMEQITVSKENDGHILQRFKRVEE